MFQQIASLFSSAKPRTPAVRSVPALPIVMRFQVVCNNELVEVVWGAPEQAREVMRKARAALYETRKGQWVQVPGLRSSGVQPQDEDYQAYLQACSWKVLPPDVQLPKAA